MTKDFEAQLYVLSDFSTSLKSFIENLRNDPEENFSIESWDVLTSDWRRIQQILDERIIRTKMVLLKK